MASFVCARRSRCQDDADHSASWLARRALLITWDAFGWAFALEIDRPQRRRLIEHLGRATPDELEQVDNAIRAVF